MFCLKSKGIAMMVLFSLTSLQSVFSQVNLTNGAAETSFPLFQYSDANRLPFAISLNYTAGNGVRVDALASNVGLGWDLSAGGVIVRQQLGEPDDQTDQNNPGSYTVPNGYLYTTYGPSTPTSPQLGYAMLIDGFNEVSLEEAASSDKLQDIFTFNFNGNTGSFVIGKNGECKTLNDSRLRITKVLADMTASNIVTRISEFTITDDSGIQYVFREKSISRIFRYSRSSKIAAVPATSMGGSHAIAITSTTPTNVYAVGSWHLTEIINPLSNKKITLSYVTNDLDYVSVLEPTLSQTEIDGNRENVIQQNKLLLEGTAKVLKSVTFPGEVNIDITYNTTPRVDVPGAAYSLKKLAVKKGTTELYAYEFTYKYFSKADLRDETYAFPADEREYARLCLISFRKTGRNGLSEPPIEFTYARAAPGIDSQDWVPKRLSTRRDYWGYYNGYGGSERPYTGTETAIASAYFNNYAEMLHYRRRLPYNDPDGGPIQGSRPTVAHNGALKTIKTPNGGTLEYSYEPNYALYNGQLKMTGGVRVKSVSVTDGLPGSVPIVTTYKYVLQNGQSSGWGYEDPVFNQTKHTIMRVPNNASATTKVASTALSVGGIVSNIQSITTARLMGAKSSRWGTEVRSFSADNYVDATLNIAGYLYMVYQLFFSGSTTKYFDVQITHPRGFAMGNSLPGLYSRVEVISGTEADNLGKTVYEYTSPGDCALLTPTLSAPFAPRPRYLPWAYGLLKRMIVYGKNNEPIKETYNDYTFLKRDGDANFASSQSSASTTLVSEVSFYNNNMHLPVFDRDDYRQVFGRTELKRTIERTYAIDGNYNEEKIEYEYDPANYLIRKLISFNEKNEKIEKRIYYPSDYTIQQGAFPLMRSSFISSEPVTTETWLVKSEQDQRLLNTEVTDYQQISNGDIKATKKYSLRATAPVPSSTLGAFNPAALIRNSTYIKEDASLTYTVGGNVADALANGRASGILYDDGGLAAIAAVKNATVSQAAFSSFEDGALGNWNITGTPVYATDASVPTGTKCLSMTGVTGMRKAGLLAASKYLITYWSKGGQLNVNGSVLENKTGRTVNGWTIHYITVTGITEAVLTGSGFVDELRLHPANAVMQTMSYDIAGNVVTEAGADNAIVKKEYDGLNRLIAIRDQQGNILEAVNYQYKGQ